MIDEKGEQLGIFSCQEALKIAQEKELDLVEVAPEAKPPVCRILDYGKFRYQRDKRRKQSKQRHSTNALKEVRMGYKIGEHDFEVKLRKIQQFLKGGHRVKVSLRFRGREMIYKERGRGILERVSQNVKEVGKVESTPSMSGRVIEQYLIPR